MAQLYSACLTKGQRNALGNLNLFTVPVGHRYVLRDAQLICQGAAAITQRFYVAGAGNPYLITAIWPAGSIDVMIQWQGRIVLNAGETFGINQTVAQRMDYSIHGYDLLG